jgi:hypothetical protein
MEEYIRFCGSQSSSSASVGVSRIGCKVAFMSNRTRRGTAAANASVDIPGRGPH